MKGKRMKRSNERVSLHNDNIFLIPDDVVDWGNLCSFKGFLTAVLNSNSSS